MHTLHSAERVLIERSKRGDTQAFDQLVARNRARVYQRAYRMTHCPEEAEDIVGQVFVKAYQSIRSFRADSAFSTWLFRIAMNCFLDRRAKKHRQCVSLDSISISADGEVLSQIVDESPSAFDRVAQEESLRAIGRAIRMLPDHQQVVLILHHLESRSYKEIAGVIRRPVGTVKSRLNRALRTTRELIESSWQDRNAPSWEGGGRSLCSGALMTR